MWHDSAIRMPFERARGLWDLKGDKGTGFASQARNCKQTVIQVPLSPFLDKRVSKFKVRVFKREICYFANL